MSNVEHRLHLLEQMLRIRRFEERCAQLYQAEKIRGFLIVFEEDVEAEMTHKLELGVAVGAPIGAIAGMTLLALIVPGVGALGVGGILAAGAATGALAGGFWGAYLGLKSEEGTAEEMWDWERIRLQEGEVMVVVDQHGHPDDVQRVLTGHGGSLVTKPVS